MTEERRRKKRQRATGPVHFRRPDTGKDPEAPSAKLPDVGIIVNVSDEGLCFITTCPLEEGQALVIQCPWLMDEAGEATVRWCRKAAVDLWRIGIQTRANGDNPSKME